MVLGADGKRVTVLRATKIGIGYDLMTPDKCIYWYHSNGSWFIRPWYMIASMQDRQCYGTICAQWPEPETRQQYTP